MNTITLIIVDDHPLFRQGVVDTLAFEPDFMVIGQASDGEEAIGLIRSFKPQIAIVDVNLPGMNGQQLTRQIVAEKLPTRVILLTAYDDAEQQMHALRVGASAYCTKDVEPERLVETIRRVAEGLVAASEPNTVLAAERRPGTLEESAPSFSDSIEPFQPLSAREMEVLTSVTRGLSNKEIAAVLGISHQTVKNHVTAILRKLGVEDRTQAAIYALKRGWVRLHQPNVQSEE